MTEEQRERKLEYYKKYYEENKQKKLDNNKKYREENREWIASCNKKWREENKEKISALRKGWREENKEVIRARNAKRRAHKRNATPTWYEQERDKVNLIYAKAQELGFHVDHIVPLRSKKVCGLHTWANLQLLAPEVNMSKNNRYWPDMP